MKTIEKILVANRGEIAFRILRTCRRMGIATVAVHSDADENAPHVRFADEAVRLGPAPASESYLSIEKILDAALRTGADAIHPGYGFLAENPLFAEGCAFAGIRFIGPPPEAIRLMGSKIESRKLMAGHGVPVTPGYDGEDQSDETLHGKILEIGFPVLVKVSAGGGGKGMVIVEREGEVPGALAEARRLGRSTFGDDTLLLEKLVRPVRHVEIQVLGDKHGNVVHVFERECSIQRRHQKIIEETPSPVVGEELRRAMGAAAVQAARAVGYQSAGTVEFLLAPDGSFSFLEMNTRLQVEHPVTELVTGLDLVELQIRIASGEPLPFGQEDLRQSGHAVECRVYAEEPGKGFLPSTGTILDWHLPDVPGLRVDSGVETGSEVSVHYDPLLAKVITHGASRSEAVQRMLRALERMSVLGVATNIDLLRRLLSHREFQKGRLSTDFIQKKFPPRTLASNPGPEVAELAALVATAWAYQQRRAAAKILPAIPSGWRNNPYREQRVSYRVGDRTVTVDYHVERPGELSLRVDGGESRVARIHELEGPRITLSVDGHRRRFRLARQGETFFIHLAPRVVQLQRIPRFPLQDDLESRDGCQAPMPGKITKILVSAGEKVEKGAPLLVLEAMKMEQTVAAPTNGIVQEILVGEGRQVEGGQLLVRLEGG